MWLTSSIHNYITIPWWTALVTIHFPAWPAKSCSWLPGLSCPGSDTASYIFWPCILMQLWPGLPCSWGWFSPWHPPPGGCWGPGDLQPPGPGWGGRTSLFSSARPSWRRLSCPRDRSIQAVWSCVGSLICPGSQCQALDLSGPGQGWLCCCPPSSLAGLQWLWLSQACSPSASPVDSSNSCHDNIWTCQGRTCSHWAGAPGCRASPVPVLLYFWPQGQKYKFRQMLKISTCRPRSSGRRRRLAAPAWPAQITGNFSDGQYWYFLF